MTVRHSLSLDAMQTRSAEKKSFWVLFGQNSKLTHSPNPGEHSSPGFDNPDAVLLLLGCVVVDEIDDIGCVDPPERSIAVARRDDFVLCIHDEFGRLDDAAAIFPPGAELFGNITRHAMPERKSFAFGYLACVVDIIDARRDDRAADAFDIRSMLFEAVQLTTTKRSPVSPVEQDDAVPRIQAAGQIQRPAPNQIEGQVREGRANSKLFRQFGNSDHAREVKI